MKRLLPIVFCLLWLSLSAQPRLQTPELYVGVHGGVMGSMIFFNPTVPGVDIKHTPFTPNGGIAFRYAGHKVCGIQVEVNYMQRAWKEVIESSQTDYCRRLNYIEVPLLMHLYFGGERGRGFVNLGPQIGYCFSSTESGTKQTQSTTQYGAIQPFDYGFALGLGGYYRTKRIGLFQLEARCNYSLGGVFGTKSTDYFSFANMLNVSVNLAYFFEIHIQ